MQTCLIHPVFVRELHEYITTGVTVPIPTFTKSTVGKKILMKLDHVYYYYIFNTDMSSPKEEKKKMNT